MRTPLRAPPVLLVSLACVGACAPTPERHCEQRQDFWERAFPDEAGDLEARQLFISSCTRNLSKPSARKELRCRDACLDAANRNAEPGSRAAIDAYQAFTACEAKCLGVADSPRDTEAEGVKK